MYYSERIDSILTVFPILHITTVEFAGGHIVQTFLSLL